MDFRDKVGNRNVTETLSFFSAIICPVAVFIWEFVNAERPFNIRLSSWTMALFFTLIYILRYISKFIRHYLFYFLYGGYSLLTIYVLYLAHYFNFNSQYSILLILVIFYTALTFDRMSYLLNYLIGTIILLGVTVYIDSGFKNIAENNGVMVIIAHIVLSIIALFNLFMRYEGRRALYESKKDYQRLLDVSPDGIIVYENYTIVYANRAFADLIKVKEVDELVGRSIFDLRDYNDYELNAVIMEEIAKGKEGEYSEISLNLSKDLSIEIEIAHITTTYNGKTAIMAVLRDISERVRMKEKLIEAEAKYRNIVEGALAGVYIIQNYEFVYVNKYFVETFGYSEEELNKMVVKKLVSDEDWDYANHVIKRLISGEKEINFEIKGVKKDGGYIYLMIQARYITYRGAPAIIGTILNITDQKIAEDKIKGWHSMTL